MKTNFPTRFRPLASLLVIAAAASLQGCTSIAYRCPLDPSDKAESPTACAGMQDALTGAKRGTGGKTSVLLDDKGRQIPSAMQANKPAVPVTGAGLAGMGAPEPYRNQSGDPVFEPPRMFQALVPAFVDADGNLHDGHHAWFTTPGRWSYGGTRDAGAAGDIVMRPALPTERPANRAATQSPRQASTPGRTTPAPTTQEKDKAAMQNLSAVANSLAKPQDGRSVPATPAQAAGVTAPAFNIGD